MHRGTCRTMESSRQAPKACVPSVGSSTLLCQLCWGVGGCTRSSWAPLRSDDGFCTLNGAVEQRMSTKSRVALPQWRKLGGYVLDNTDGPWAGIFYSGQRSHRSAWEIITWVEAIHTCRGHRSERTGRLPGSTFSPLLVKNKQMKQKGEWEEWMKQVRRHPGGGWRGFQLGPTALIWAGKWHISTSRHWKMSLVALWKMQGGGRIRVWETVCLDLIKWESELERSWG